MKSSEKLLVFLTSLMKEPLAHGAVHLNIKGAMETLRSVSLAYPLNIHSSPMIPSSGLCMGLWTERMIIGNSSTLKSILTILIPKIS
jgi:hypothetical protein